MNLVLLGIIGGAAGLSILLTLLFVILAWRDVRPIPDIAGRLTRAEHYIHSINNNITTLTSILGTPEGGDQASITYRTADGKYQSSSLEGLVSQITNDPNSSVSPEIIDELRKMFEGLTDEPPELESDDPDSNWK